MTTIIKRNIGRKIMEDAGFFPAITLMGPRQSGKTTLCRMLFPNHACVSLEEPDVRSFATEDPRGFLDQLPDGAIIDEVQHVPSLLSYLLVRIDNDPQPGRWILVSSQNLLLLESVTQSLAGRTAVHHLLPLTRQEVSRFPKHPLSLEESLLFGSYPAIFHRKESATDWYESHISDTIERDVGSIANIGDLAQFQRFLGLCAGRTSLLVNHSGIADDCGVSQSTIKSWLNILQTGFIAFQLPAFHAKLRKRLIKVPKLHFFDSGLLCSLLGIHRAEQLHTHPLRSSIFKSWVVSEAVKQRNNLGRSRGLAFYKDSSGGEADLVIDDNSPTCLLNTRYSRTPSLTMFKGTDRARDHLSEITPSLDAAVIYGGDQVQTWSNGQLIPWDQLDSVIGLF